MGLGVSISTAGLELQITHSLRKCPPLVFSVSVFNPFWLANVKVNNACALLLKLKWYGFSIAEVSAFPSTFMPPVSLMNVCEGRSVPQGHVSNP